MKYRLNGFSTPLFGLSWDKTMSEKDMVKYLFRYLSSKRILTNPIEMEIPNQCIESVLEIRKLLVQVTSGFEPSGKLWQQIESMIYSCNRYLDDLNKLNLPHIIYKNNDQWADLNFDSAMKNFRNGLKESVFQLEKLYGIQSNIYFSEKW